VNEQIGIEGSVLVVNVRDKNGQDVPIQSVLIDPNKENPGFLGPNLVVDGGRRALANLLAGVVGNQIAAVSFGKGDTPPKYDDTTLSPQPLTIDGSNQGGGNTLLLAGDATSKAITDISLPSPYIVQVRFELGYDDANGEVVREIGLWTESGVLFARKSIPGIIKSSENQLEMVWSLRV